MKPAILFVNTGTGRNLGDRAMLLNLLEKISQHGSDLLLVPRQLPEVFRREFRATPYTPYHECLDRFRRRLPSGTIGGILLVCVVTLHAMCMALACLLCRVVPLPLSSREDEIQLLAHLRRVDAIWLNGGGYLTDKGEYECRCCLLTAVFALLMGKKVVLTGQGIGPIHSRLTRWLLRYVTRHAAYVSVRDEVRSAEFLAQLTDGRVPVVMAGDDASSLAMPPEPTAAANEPETRPQLRIALHFRISPFTENSETLKKQFADTIADVFARGWRPVFFIFTSQAEWEQNLLRDLLAGAADNSYEIVVSDDPRTIKSHIARCDLALGIAYHFVVFCLTTGTPVIALYGGEYYRYKMSGILKQYDKENWMTEFHSFVPANILSALAGYYDDGCALTNRLQQDTRRIQQQHQQSTEQALAAIQP